MDLSANRSLDLLARSYEFEAVSAPVQENSVMLWVGTSLSISGVPLLIGEGELEEIIETPPVTAIPGTKPWVMGVAAHKGGLLPIISGDVLFRKQPYSGRVREYCMVIRRPGYYFGVTLSKIERTMKFPIHDRLMDQTVDPDFAPYSLGGFEFDNKFLAILDIDKLIADADLSNASATAQDPTEDHSDD